MSTLRTLKTIAAGLTTAVLAVALSGCLQFGAGDAERDDDGNVLEESTIGVFSLTLGDCVAETALGEVAEIKVVPCSEPHGGEVYYEHTMPEGDYPGDAVIQDVAQDECLRSFETFVDIDWDDSTLDISWFYPNETSWTRMRDRLIQCIVTDPAGPVTGSLQGAQR